MKDLIKRAATDLVNSKYAIALSGAGISTESEIPDFRGPKGIWTLNPEAEKRAYESYQKLQADPKGYWEERLSGGPLQSLLDSIKDAKPNPGHTALAELEEMNILKSVITQNVDELHQKGGSKNVIEYHGGFSKLRCMQCGQRFSRDEIDLEQLKNDGDLPPICKCSGVIKGDTVHFREPIPNDVINNSNEEAWKCDLMLICGTSAVVYPFASLPQLARQSNSETVIIEVNAEPTPLTGVISNYLIQGKAGDILPKIVKEIALLKANN